MYCLLLFQGYSSYKDAPKRNIAYLVKHDVRVHLGQKSCVLFLDNFSVVTSATADYHTQDMLRTSISWGMVDVEFLSYLNFSFLI